MTQDRNNLPRITGTSVIDDQYLMRVHELAHGAATTGLEINDALLGMAVYIKTQLDAKAFQARMARGELSRPFDRERR